MLVKDQIDAFSSATSMLGALHRREISALELLEAHLHRIEQFDPTLNSVVVRDFDRARREAIAIDNLPPSDDRPLAGLPITIKESLDVEGTPSTAGVPARKGHLAPRDCRTVARLRAAGALIFGKTNVCTWLTDYQADNPVYGRTNNPWDLARTSGGSSGGSATLAAGLTALDIGSDLGGSIRVPAAFCGLWGHKPSDSLVPNSGHFPGSEFPNPAIVLTSQGPHARSAQDLELALDVMTGPDVGADAAWSLKLPPPRHQRLSDFRIAVLPPEPWLPVEQETLDALRRTADELRYEGCTVHEVAPIVLGDLRDYYALFRSMMSVVTSARWSEEQRRRTVGDKLWRGEVFHAADARGITASAADLLAWLEQREIYRAAWRIFFREFDILVAPITLTPAFEHSTVATANRRLIINGHPVEFEYMSFYPALASLTGNPTTVFPTGLTSAGLPIGLQALGPYLEDRTPLRFAQLLESLMGHFSPPPGYSAALGL
jgi:amidase